MPAKELTVPKETSLEKKLASEIICDRAQEGWLYLSAVLDLFSRRIVGWSVANHMRTELISDALLMAIGRRRPSGDLLHHSDRGSQYASADYQQLLKRQGIRVSMSRKGNCWDNAVMERFFGSLKSERTDGKNYLTREQAKADVIDYIEMFYNSQRLHSSLNYISPMQFEKLNESCLKMGKPNEPKPAADLSRPRSVPKGFSLDRS